jgi:ATP-binding cassette subfamily B protein
MAAELAGRAGLVRDHALAKVRLGAVFGAGVSLTVGLAGAAIYSVGGLWVASGTVTMGTLVAVASLLAMIYGPVTTLSTMKLDLVAGFVSFERVKEVMQFRPAVDGP